MFNLKSDSVFSYRNYAHLANYELGGVIDDLYDLRWGVLCPERRGSCQFYQLLVSDLDRVLHWRAPDICHRKWANCSLYFLFDRAQLWTPNVGNVICTLRTLPVSNTSLGRIMRLTFYSPIHDGDISGFCLERIAAAKWLFQGGGRGRPSKSWCSRYVTFVPCSSQSDYSSKSIQIYMIARALKRSTFLSPSWVWALSRLPPNHLLYPLPTALLKNVQGDVNQSHQ